MYHKEILDYHYAFNLPSAPPAAANTNMAHVSPEAALYWEFLLDLLFWATHGYPRERLTRDLRWQSAR